MVAMLLSFGMVYAMNDGEGVTKEADGIKAELTFMDKNVKTGNNDLMVKLNDMNGKPIVGAKVKLEVQMDKAKDSMGSDAMKDVKPQQVDLESSHEEGQYMGKVNFTDEGTWMAKISFTVDGKEKIVEYSVDVAKGGPNWYIIGGFLGFVAIVIIIAAILKKKKKTVAA